MVFVCVAKTLPPIVILLTFPEYIDIHSGLGLDVYVKGDAPTDIEADVPTTVSPVLFFMILVLGEELSVKVPEVNR